jgi:hypothetical protein
MLTYGIPAMFGFIVGAVVGFTLQWMMPATLSTMLSQSLAGIVVGGVFGGAIGSISGELNASAGTTGTHRVLVAIAFGALGGFLGATKLELVWVFFRYMQWRVPSQFVH